MDKLQQTLSAKEREKQTLNRQFDDGISLVEKSKGEWDSKEASYKHQIGSLTKMVAQLKGEFCVATLDEGNRGENLMTFITRGTVTRKGESLPGYS